MLKIGESSSENGELAAIFLSFESGTLLLFDSQGKLPLPQGALEAVMARFGAPFDPNQRILEVAQLELTTGHKLRHVRHLAGYDVISRDYLVFDRPDASPLCALAATVSAALAHLGRAAERNARQAAAVID
jgi:hypothetical protein